MYRVKFFVAMVLLMALFSCTPAKQKNKIVIKKDGKAQEFTNTDEYRLKGTNTEIMNAFKANLPRQEFELFSNASLKIITKIKKIEEGHQYYNQYKKSVDIYEQYDISMTRVEYDMVVNIKYSILSKEMNLKTNEIGYKEVVRERREEALLLKKVKRLLYGN
ncbi:hypothetical protein ACFL2A_04890 [Thermodesulfobacteriota bacterium]